MTTAVRPHPIAVPRFWARDSVFVSLSLVHAAALLLAPSVALIAVGLWWNANTIAHNFIHRPFFRSKAANALYSMYLSLVLGVPQRLWRARHLAHHAGLDVRNRRAPGRRTVIGRLKPADYDSTMRVADNNSTTRAADGDSPVRAAAGDSPARAADYNSPARPWPWTAAMLVEGGLVLTLWALLATTTPGFFVRVYLPGYVLGLGLCALQGHFEHARGTTSHYGWVYNALFFNDGYHVEHHARPGESWINLPALAAPETERSRWPAVLRWLEWFNLESLERLVLRSPRLQRFVLAAHERAVRAILPHLPPVTRVTIVGGGLFPRTALILRRLLPEASLVIVEANATHLAMAQVVLGAGVEYRRERWDARQTDASDLVVIPLAFDGDRRRVYERPAAPFVLVHDWMWVRHAPSARVSWLLCKRLNLVRR